MPKARRKARTHYEDLFALHCRAYELPVFKREHVFAPKAGRWRFDFWFPAYSVGVEIEGLVIVGQGSAARLGTGRHHTVTGFRNDLEKYNFAAFLLVSPLRFEQRQVESGYAVRFTALTLRARGWNPPPQVNAALSVLTQDEMGAATTRCQCGTSDTGDGNVH